MLASNGARVLSRLGFSFERARGQHVTAWDTLDGRTLAKFGSLDLTNAEERYGAPLMCVHRVDLHQELLRLAAAEDTNAPKVQLHLQSTVVDARPVEGEIALADGSVHKADLVVAADGLHSALKRAVLGPQALAPASTGISAFRFLIKTENLMDDPQLVEFLERKCKGPTVLADTQEMERERHIVWYDCQGSVFHVVPSLAFQQCLWVIEATFRTLSVSIHLILRMSQVRCTPQSIVEKSRLTKPDDRRVRPQRFHASGIRPFSSYCQATHTVSFELTYLSH